MQDLIFHLFLFVGLTAIGYMFFCFLQEGTAYLRNKRIQESMFFEELDPLISLVKKNLEPRGGLEPGYSKVPDGLLTDHEELLNQYEDLKDQYDTMSFNFDQLQKSREKLATDYESLKGSLDDTLSANSKLFKEKQELHTRCEHLQNQVNLFKAEKEQG